VMSSSNRNGAAGASYPWMYSRVRFPSPAVVGVLLAAGAGELAGDAAVDLGSELARALLRSSCHGDGGGVHVSSSRRGARGCGVV
jgi:hypothetical protein